MRSERFDWKDWRMADQEWMQRRKEEMAALPSRQAARKLYTPRFEFKDRDDRYKLAQMKEVGFNISQCAITFEAYSTEITSQAMAVLLTIEDALLEYPELVVAVEAWCGLQDTFRARRKGKGNACDPETLAQNRAATIRQAYVQRGIQSIVSDRGFGLDERQPYGRAKIVPYMKDCSSVAVISDPQARLDMILTRSPLQFIPKSLQFDPAGTQTIEMCARVLRETRMVCSIKMPQNSSTLAMSRADAIKAALFARGTRNRVEVEVSNDNRGGASLELQQEEEDSSRQEESDEILDVTPKVGEDVAGTQEVLNALLTATPIVFASGEAEVVSDCVPILNKLAEAMKGLEKTSCRIEVYSGIAPAGQTVSLRDDNEAAALSTKRAKRLATRLRQLGVRAPLTYRGYNYPKLTGTGNTRPHAELILIDAVLAGEEEFLAYDNDSPFCSDFVACNVFYINRCQPDRKPAGIHTNGNF